MRLASIVAIGVVLTGCASPQETALLNDQKCRSDGLRPGTGEYDKCRQQENLVRAMRQQQDSMQQNMQSISRLPTR
jgi:hypothetical protein